MDKNLLTGPISGMDVPLGTVRRRPSVYNQILNISEINLRNISKNP